MTWLDKDPPASISNPDLVIAQYKSLSRQAPLIYLIGLVGGWSLAISHWSVAPAWAVIYYPILVSIVSAIRIANWLKARKADVSVIEAKKQLDRSHVMAILVPLLFGFWGFSLFPYGDLALQGQVIFTVCVGTVSIMFCVLHLRTAMLIGVLCINVIGLAYFLVYQNFDHFAVFLSSVVFCGALTFVFRNYYEDFLQLVTVGQQLKAKQTQLELKAEETERLARENEKLANHDALTGLPNRRLFFSVLEAKCTQAQTKGHLLALCIFDLGGFKALNDLFGHVAGDSLLLQVGTRLKAKVGNSFIARLGGDEFCVLIENAANVREAEMRARDIRDIFNAPFLVPGGGVSLSGFVGVAILDDDAPSYVNLYENAAFALRVSKRKSDQHFVVFGEEQREEMRKTVLLERTLLNANLFEELSLEYQPIIDIRSNRVLCFEALARWKSPEIGEVPPSDFIPVAEHSGYINQLTSYLLERALREARDWPEDIGLSFNLSATNLSSAETVSQLLTLVERSGFAPERLEFEITETAVMWDYEQSLKAVRSLKKTGVRISLDDFGTGYSSLKQMHELPLDKIKVDRSFVRGITNDPTCYGIVKSLLTLSHDMNIECVIEGVETGAELETVKEIGGDLVQGFLLGRPLPPTGVPDCLAKAQSKQREAWLSAS